MSWNCATTHRSRHAAASRQLQIAVLAPRRCTCRDVSARASAAGERPGTGARAPRHGSVSVNFTGTVRPRVSTDEISGSWNPVSFTVRTKVPVTVYAPSDPYEV